MNDDTHTVTESDLARQIGVPRADLRSLRRQMLDPSEFCKKNGRGICYSLDAAKKLATAVASGATSSLLEPSGCQDTTEGLKASTGGSEVDVSPTPDPKPQVMVVVRWCSNPRLLIADTRFGALVTVACRPSARRLLAPGRKIRVLPGKGIYNYYGKYPRRYGVDAPDTETVL